MSNTQMPSVAGLFYPDDPQVLSNTIARMLESTGLHEGAAPKALIAPHAGYVYSGPIAASAYAQLAPVREQVRRVVLLAPSHRVAFRGLAISSATAFNTPLGDIPVDREALDRLESLPQVRHFDQAFEGEHALEVQLPFLQQVLKDFALVPLIVGDASAAEVTEVLETLWGDDQTLIVVSSDLSHYQDYDSAARHDRHTTALIENLDENLAYGDACGRNPVRGLLRAARQHGLAATTIDLRNSGDTAGDHSRVVGYGAYVFR